MTTIEIDIQVPFRGLVDAERLRRAAAQALALEAQEGDIVIILTGDEEVADLNQRFLNREGPTDVLSFPAQTSDETFVLPPEAGEETYLGDVIIAFPYAQRQAHRLGHDLHDELILLVVHGVLHLLGYDHTTPEAKARMWARQQAILESLGVDPAIAQDYVTV